MIRPDSWIIDKCKTEGMISPWVESQIKEDERGKIVSYGVSSYGYDIRIGNQFKTPKLGDGQSLDPKRDNDWSDVTVDKYVIIPPNGFVLGTSVETLKIPRNVACTVLGKSTYARLGLVVNVTPLEPEWEGQITMELSNTTPYQVKVYANEGIAQVLFFESDTPCTVSYADKKGKYQNQVGVVTAKV